MMEVDALKTLREHRQAAPLSTRELAAKAHVAAATVGRIERGEVQEIRPRTMRAIAEVLGVKVQDIQEFAGAIGAVSSV